MKKITILLSLFCTTLFASANPFLCSSGDCGVAGADIIGAAPTDGTVSYLVWFITSASAPTSAIGVPQPSATSGSASILPTVITPTGGNNYTISIPFTVDPNQAKSTIQNVDFILSYYTAASFPGTAATASMAVATSTPLPVEFISVDALYTQDAVIVNWKTASEINNALFSIEKSIDGEEWTTIGNIEGAGNSNEVLDYSFTDNNSKSNTKAFYRVKQTDYDGQFDYSDVVSVTTSYGQSKVYPNPTQDADFVTIQSLTTIQTVEVRNISGQVIAASFHEATSRLDISDLESGVYYITVNEDIIKMIK